MLIRRLSLSVVLALLFIGAQASAVLAAANETNGSCIAQFMSNQPPGGVAEAVTSNNQEAHPFGVVVVSFTAVNKPPCFEE